MNDPINWTAEQWYEWNAANSRSLLRDEFAMACLISGQPPKEEKEDPFTYGDVARMCYRMADAMLAERAKK